MPRVVAGGMRDHLGTYLNDHLAGATLGANLARRIAQEHRGSPLGEPLTVLAAAIADDRRALLGVMGRLGVHADRVKVLGARVAELAGRLKPNDRLRGYSDLSRLEELEALLLGVQGKLLLWETLDATAGADGQLAGVDLDDLHGRAAAQRATLLELRADAAQVALAA